MKHIIKFGIVLFFVLLIPMGLYFSNFHGGLSFNHTTWGEFGSFYGGVLGPAISLLAIIGLLWNLYVTTKQFRLQSENSIFFNLLTLHNNKVQSVEFENKEDGKITGFSAFKEYVEKFNLKYDNSIREDKGIIIKNDHALNKNPDLETKLYIIKEINKKFYHDFGHIFGHYFRNIYYILKFIDKTELSETNSKIFRAQLSRYELTALYYNAISNLPGAKYIELLIKYDILNGIYSSDICYSPDKIEMKDVLDYILKEKRGCGKWDQK